MKSAEISIHWFRRDLRLADNPALLRAARTGRVLPVFIDDPDQPQEVALGAASRAWLHEALAALDRALGGGLNIFRGPPQDVLCALAERHGATMVSCGALPDPALAPRDARIRAALKERGIEVAVENGFLLWTPGEVRKADGTPYRVFTPFFRRGCLSAPPPRAPLPAPAFETLRDGEALPLAALGLWPRQDWAKDVLAHWQPDEVAAQKRLHRFVADRLARYPDARDHPGDDGTSRLSPHLHFGVISPNQVWDAARGPGADKLRAELGWREFSWNLLVHN
ncbi:MAG TPA: deoxyribodipyrimidine photo-lyase, partial [Rhodobacterales bacterium]|nr:deoxyribodipyrimidine photo-lyase [Rhodobacterales bacterium]